MNATEYLKKLSFGHLSELAIGGMGSGVIPEEHIPKLVHWANGGLQALYTRFPLDSRLIIVETVDGLSTYHLRSQFAQTSTSTEPVKYLKDSAASPFVGQVLAITNVYDHEMCELPLNEQHDEVSWFTQGPDSLQMGYPVTGDRYFVRYRAEHPRLSLDPVNVVAQLDTTQLVVPNGLEEALLLHVAASVYGAMSMEGAMIKSAGLMKGYERECQIHEQRNTFHDSVGSANSRFEKGGWV